MGMYVLRAFCSIPRPVLFVEDVVGAQNSNKHITIPVLPLCYDKKSPEGHIRALGLCAEKVYGN
jgi:hypothetical protein